MALDVRGTLEAIGWSPSAGVRGLASELELDPSFSLAELLELALGNESFRRPFYAIAHRCNSVAAVESALAAGANAIECDIRATGHASEFVVNHDNDWHPDRDAIRPYLDGVAALGKAHPGLALVLFDCKTDDPADSSRLRDIIRTHLTDVVDVNVVISVAAFESRFFFEPIADGMRPREAYAIDEHNDPQQVSQFFSDLGVTRHAFGNGTFAYGHGPNIPPSIMRAVRLKWSRRRIRMVYVWTLQDEGPMRNYIRMGADGIFVNDVSELHAIVHEPDIARHVRLATRADNPFDPPPRRACIVDLQTGDVTHGGTDARLTVAVHGTRGSVETVIDTGALGVFEAGDENPVTLIGRHVGRPRELVLSIDDSGNAPGWFLESASFRSPAGTVKKSFSVSRFIEPGDVLRLGIT